MIKKITLAITLICFTCIGFTQEASINKEALTDKWWEIEGEKIATVMKFHKNGTYQVKMAMAKGKWSWDDNTIKVKHGMMKFNYEVSELTEERMVLDFKGKTYNYVPLEEED